MLSPYTVIELSSLSTCLCGQILAQLGATVIAVEPPTGSRARRVGPFLDPSKRDPESSLYWWAYNRGKKSVTLEVEKAQGRAALVRLLGQADFLIEGFAPGHLASLGLSWEELQRINPRLIVVSITPFGQSGPKAKYAASDLVILAASGVLAITGDSDRPPLRAPISQSYLHASAEAALAALIAHQERVRSGRGQAVDVSAQTATMMATQALVLGGGWGDSLFARAAGGIEVGPIHLRFVYRCADGHVSITLLFGESIGPATKRLMEWMCEEGFVDKDTVEKDWIDYVRLLRTGAEPITELFRIMDCVGAFCQAHTKRELSEGARGRSILLAPVATVPELVESAQLRARDYWVDVVHPQVGRPVRYPGAFAKLSRVPLRMEGRAPLLGEHNAEVLGGRLACARAVPAQDRPGPRLGAASDLPFSGLKVLDMSWVMVGPTVGRYLADYGATVVHVESSLKVDATRTLPPFKDGVSGVDRSAFFTSVNANKLGLALDLTHPRGRDLVLALVRWADVLLESFTPRVMRSWGLGYEALARVKPDLVMVSTCLFGQTGPEAGFAGYGNLSAAVCGFVELIGWPDRDPAGPFGAYTDYIAPKFIAAALLAALDHRRRTGEGQYLDAAQAEAALHFIAPAILEWTAGKRIPSRAGNRSPEAVPHGVYPCRGDDRWVAIAVHDEEQWRRLCEVTGNAGWAADARFATDTARRENEGALDALISAWTKEREPVEIERALQAVGVAAHAVLAPGEMMEEPQLAHRGHFVAVERGGLGPVPIERSRFRLGRGERQAYSAGPAYGQDNDFVLREILGLGEHEVEELKACGVLR